MAKVEGMDRLRRKFQEMPKVVREEVKKAVVTSASELVAMQKRLVPKDKGTLEASIRYEMAEEFKALVIAGGTAETKRGPFDEALLVEFGTKPHENKGMFEGSINPGVPARPYFFPAWRAMKKRSKGRISRSITNGIKKVAAGGQ